MKPFGLAILTFGLLFQAAAFGESTLTFAYLMDKTEMANVGIAIVNPGNQDAAATFTLYGSMGQVIEAANVMIPAGGQAMRTAAQLFPAAGKGGWIQATSDATGLRGFWTSGDSRNAGDGAEAESSGTDLILPLITDQSEIVVVNTSASETAIRIRIYGANGQEIAEPLVRVLPPKGSFRAASTALFTVLDWAAATHVKISSGAPVVASAEVSNFRVAPSLSVVNGVSAAAAPTGFVFSHVVQGPHVESSYVTTIGITNISAAPQIIEMTFVPADGSAPKTIQQLLPGGGGIRASARSFFGFGDEFQLGWVRVSAPQGAVGFAANADAQGGATVTAGMFRPQSSFIFGHIADLPPWWTGLTLVNPGQTSADVEIFAMAPDGRLIGGADNIPAARFTIPANGKTSHLLSEWIPKTQSRTTDGGFVFVRSNVPLHGLSLFFTRDLRILSIVPAFDLSPGITFEPPQTGVKP